MAAPWSDLTYEVLVQIFRRLGFEDRYVVVSAVCRPWYQASRDSACWVSADMEECFEKTVETMSLWWSPEFEQKMDKMITNVVDWSNGTLMLLHTRHCSDQALAYAATRCPQLHSLSIKESPNFTDSSATRIAASCPMLEHVDISQCHNVSAVFLRELGLKCEGLLTLKRNITRATNLQRPLEYIRSAGEEATLIGSLMKNLRHLELKDWTFLSDGGLNVIVAGCPRLEVFNLDGCISLSMSALELVAFKLPGLKQFTRPFPHVPANYAAALRYGHWQLYSNRFQDVEY